MIARPYAIACMALLAVMFAVAAVLALHLRATGTPHLFLDIVFLFLVPVVATMVALMWLLVRALMPASEYAGDASAATGTIVAAQLLAAAVTPFSFMVSRALGMAWPGLNLVFAVLGALMIVMGNAAGKLPPNHMFGFRSLWALEDADVWGKTQRFGGWVMVIAGFVVLNAALLFDLGTVNWITLVASCGSSLLITFASRHFARQKRKARDAEWARLAQ